MEMYTLYLRIYMTQVKVSNKGEFMEDFNCLKKCEKTEFTGKLDPSKEPPAFVEETEEVQS